MTDSKGMGDYIASRRDVALIGEGYGDSVIFCAEDEPITVSAGEGNALRMVVLANAYEATDAMTGEKSLFLVRGLEPMAYNRVEIGHTYVPAGCAGGTDEQSPTPAVESFPLVLHSTNLLRDKLACKLVASGEYAEEPALEFALLVVALGQGTLPDGEWSGMACERRLAGMSSGACASATLNMDGRMSVEVVGRIRDSSKAANEAVVAFDAYARRMWALHGTGWESEAGLDRFSMRLSGNLLYSLPGFILQEGDRDDPRKIARDMLVPMRLRSAAVPSENRPSVSVPVSAEMPCDDLGALCVMVALSALADPSEEVNIRMRQKGMSDRSDSHMDALSMELGSVIASESEGKRVASSLGRLVFDGYETEYAKVLVEALLGSPYGHMILAEDIPPMAPKMRSSSAAALALGVALVETEGYDSVWANWVASKIRGIIGSVAYAKAVVEALHDMCSFLDLYGTQELLEGNAPDSVAPDWATIAIKAREVEREHMNWQAVAGDSRHDAYDNWYDEDEDWYESELRLYDMPVDHGDAWQTVASDADVEKANRFVDLCLLYRAGRAVLAKLDAAGLKVLLSEYPILGVILSEDGTPRPIHNDIVASAFEAFKALATEDGFDGDGRATGLTLPGVIMDDGTVMGCHIEERPDGKCVARLTCDGKADCMMVNADMDGFDSPEDIMQVIFDIAVAMDEEPDDAGGKASA